jgi:hypothetical protein
MSAKVLVGDLTHRLALRQRKTQRQRDRDERDKEKQKDRERETDRDAEKDRQTQNCMETFKADTMGSTRERDYKQA